MNYEENRVQWRPGDLVLHDADAKCIAMLMVVVGYDRQTGLCITRYLTPGAINPHVPDRKRYHNLVRLLHDPARFGIQVADRLPVRAYVENNTHEQGSKARKV